MITLFGMLSHQESPRLQRAKGVSAYLRSAFAGRPILLALAHDLCATPISQAERKCCGARYNLM